MKICAVVQSGVGKGAFFTQVDWVVRQCEDLLGFIPFPGTLNVQVCEKDLAKVDDFLSSTDGALVPDNPKFCTARIKKVLVNNVPAAVVLPSEDVRIHESRVVEVIAPQRLKDLLGIGDGDKVTLSD